MRLKVAGLLILVIFIAAWMFYSFSETDLVAVSEDKTISNESQVLNISYKKEFITHLLKGTEVEKLNLSNQLKSRLKAKEFQTLWDQEFFIDLSIASIHQWSEYTSIIFDAVIKRENKYQWIQLKTIWDQEKLMDIQLQPIDYYSRVTATNIANEEALAFAKQVVKDVKHIDGTNFGWRYQQDNPIISKAVKTNDILESKIIAANNNGELLINLKYKITLIDQVQYVEALLFVKAYSDKIQIEDIQIIEVNKIGDEQ